MSLRRVIYGEPDEARSKKKSDTLSRRIFWRAPYKGNLTAKAVSIGLTNPMDWLKTVFDCGMPRHALKSRPEMA